jgi:putative peptidoglycan lipid II flippase
MNPEFAMWWLAIGTTLGVLVQFGGQIPTLLKHGFRFRPLVDLHDPMLKEALKMALPIFVYVMGTVITTSCRNAFALDVAPNGPSTMAYARMWWQLPYGVVAVSLATTLLTELSDCAAREDWQGFREYVSKGLRSTVFLMMPLAAMVGALSIPLIQLFRAGAFTADDVQMVASVLSVWTLCLPFYAGYMYFYQVFAAMRQFVLFAAIDVGLRVVQVFMYAVVVKTDLGLLGIPFCDLVFFAAMFMICSWLVRRKVGSFGFRKVAVLLVKGGIAAVIAGALVFGASWAIESFLVIPGLPTVIYALLVCLVCGIPGLVACFALCKLFRMEEFEAMDGILRSLKRRLGHSAE